MPDTIFKRADHGGIKNAGITRHPIQTPQAGLGVKKPQGETLKGLAFLAWELGGRIRVVELGPFLAVFQSFVEVGDYASSISRPGNRSRLGDDVADAVISNSPFSSKFTFGIAMIGSLFRTVCWACPM